MFKCALFLLAGLATVAAQTCGPNGAIAIAGSSTVEPIARKWAEEYMKKCSGVTIKVEGGGSSVGAGRVCNSTPLNPNLTAVDIGNMSRKWRTGASRTEANTTDFVTHTCFIGDKTRKTTQVEVALDGVSVVLVSGGLAAQCLRKVNGLSPAQLRWMFSNLTEIVQGLTTPALLAAVIPFPDGNEATRNWKEISNLCPSADIRIGGPDILSGTNEFFREAIGMNTGTTGIPEYFSNRGLGYFNSDKDEVIVKEVESSSDLVYGDMVTYFGFSFYLEEGALLYGVPIKNPSGVFVAPLKANIEDDTYAPMSRRIYMQVLQTEESLKNTKPFIEWGLSNIGTTFTDSTGYVGLPLAQRTAQLARLALPPPSDVAPVKPTAPPASGLDEDEPQVLPAKNCGLLKLNFFCLNGCGLFGRILRLCK